MESTFANMHAIIMGDHRTLKVLNVGMVALQLAFGKKLLLKDVLHVLTIGKKFVSWLKLCKKWIKYRIVFERVILLKVVMFVGKSYASVGIFKFCIHDIVTFFASFSVVCLVLIVISSFPLISVTTYNTLGPI